MMMSPSTRRERQMYRYEASSRAGFIELSDDSVGPPQLRALLLQVPRVCEVVPHRAGSKAEQGNASEGHAQKHNWQVQSVALRGANPLEFEVTTHNHVKPAALNGRRPTVTVCFREPPHGAVREAWRILWGAVGHLALFPDKVREWMRDAEEKELRELCGRSASGPAPPPIASLPTTIPGPPPRVVQETWGTYGYLAADDCLHFLYSKGDDEAHFFLESDARRLGWRKFVDEVGAWWCNEAAGKWFREKNGQI